MTSAGPPRLLPLSSLLVGTLLLCACLLGALFANNFTQFFRSYLTGYLFILGLALGSLALLMMQHLTGGRAWLATRRMMEAASRTLPLLTLLFLPLIPGLPTLYPWAHPDEVRRNSALGHNHPYLNTPFFLGRAAFYFAVWLILAYLLNRWSHQQDRQGDDDYRLVRRMRALSGPGLVLYFFTMSFAGVDWVMSLLPDWSSTIYGMIIVQGQGLSALAFLIAAASLLAGRPTLAGALTADRFHDLGKMLLAFVMLWAYLAFSQLLIIWTGNLKEEIPWYTSRFNGGWMIVGILLITCHFAAPFLLLLSRSLKRRGKPLLAVAVWVLFMRLLDDFWLTAPSFHPGRFSLHWMDLVLPAALFCLWLAWFCWQIEGWPLLPPRDPYLPYLQASLQEKED